MASAGPDTIVFGLYKSRRSRTVMGCIVLMLLAMEVDVTGRSLSLSMLFFFQSKFEKLSVSFS